ncbi:MAG: hypothetical protein R2834_18495 [Rhodothermales bacterium]
MRRSRDVDVRLARSQEAIRNLRELVPYFEKGLLSLKPSPQEWVARIYVTERKFVREYIEGLLRSVGADAGDGISDKPPKVEQLNRIIEAIEKYRVQLGEANAMLLRKRVEHNLSGFLLESAERDTSKGNRERALDQYIEALDMMRTDIGDDPDQKNRIENIKTRIRDLGGKVPKRWEEAERLDRLVD